MYFILQILGKWSIKLKIENKIMVHPLLLTDQFFLSPDKPKALYFALLQNKTYRVYKLCFCSKRAWMLIYINFNGRRGHISSWKGCVINIWTELTRFYENKLDSVFHKWSIFYDGHLTQQVDIVLCLLKFWKFQCQTAHK